MAIASIAPIPLAPAITTNEDYSNPQLTKAIEEHAELMQCFLQSEGPLRQFALDLLERLLALAENSQRTVIDGVNIGPLILLAIDARCMHLGPMPSMRAPDASPKTSQSKRNPTIEVPSGQTPDASPKTSRPERNPTIEVPSGQTEVSDTESPTEEPERFEDYCDFVDSLEYFLDDTNHIENFEVRTDELSRRLHEALPYDLYSKTSSDDVKQIIERCQPVFEKERQLRESRSDLHGLFVSCAAARLLKDLEDKFGAD